MSWGSHLSQFSCDRRGDILDGIEALDGCVVDVELDCEFLFKERNQRHRAERIEDSTRLQRCVVAQVRRRLAGELRRQDKRANGLFDVVHYLAGYRL